MRLPGMGFTSASCIAYSTQNGVSWPTTSPGSNHRGESVTYNAQRISPSGLGWEAASSTGPLTSIAHAKAVIATANPGTRLRRPVMPDGIVRCEVNRDRAPDLARGDLERPEAGHGLDRVAHGVRAELRPPLTPEVVGDLSAVDHREHRRERGCARGDPPVVFAGAEDVVALALASLHAALHLTGLPQGHTDFGHHQPHRSEEHTSELQSQSNLVCRLLLEKKKNKNP